MRFRVPYCFFAIALLFGTLAAVRPALAALPTPNQPILVIQDSTSSYPYQNFVPEMLTTEGLNGFQVAQLSDLTATFLTPANYDVVILPHLTLTSAQEAIFQAYVNAGGTLVGFRPDLKLAGVFGVASLGTTLQEAWLKMDTTTPYAPSSDSEAMRFHGAADLYSLSGASALATLFNTPALPTTSPAVAINTYGTGKAILFSFDLTQSIVLMRQGNPAWAGYPNNHDGNNTMRASQMFMDQPSGQFWNDQGDGTLNDVPQADIQLRLFSNLVTITNAAKRPLPRLWYFPNQSRSQLLMTADDHSFPVSDAQAEFGSITAFGGQFSYNLWYPFDPINKVSTAQVNTWMTGGNTLAIHFDDTAEVDSSGVGGSKATWAGMQSVMSSALTSFTSTYPSAPFPATTRNHFLIWVSNDADGTADQVAQAKLFQNNGIQLDTSYSSFPNRWGYMTGSGLPMKFLDTKAGTVIPVYEQATQYEDDVQDSTDGYSTNWNQSTAQGHYLQSISDSSNKYNTVITMLFHPENWANYGSYVQSTLLYAQTQSIPISTTGKWLAFWKARAATTMTMPSFSAGTLSFTATGSPDGLSLLIPEASGTNKVVSTFKVDGVTQSFKVASYQGVTYASVVLTAGTHSISVTYAAAGRIIGQITPSLAAPTTVVQVQGGSITQNVPVAANGTFTAGPLPAGTYTVSPVSPLYLWTPGSRQVTLAAVDVTGVNFSAATLSMGETLFTSQVPQLTGMSDGPGVNYELGTVFTSGVAGQVTGIRFWKDSNETGTHIGHIWSTTGQALATVTFASETPSGWQAQALSSPLTIAAGTPYVVTVNTTNTFYVATNYGLATKITNLDLSSVVGNNGLYGPPGQLPASMYENNSYFRDIYFVPTPTITVASVTLNPTSVTGGVTSTGTVTLAAPAPTGGAVVSLSSSSSAATVPLTVTVPAGSTTVNFTVTTQAVGKITTPSITASAGSSTVSATLTVNPPVLTSLTLTPSFIMIGGMPGMGSITISSPAPAGGLVINLSDNSSAINEASTVTVPAGATSVSFTFTTLPVLIQADTITATFNDVAKSANIILIL